MSMPIKCPYCKAAFPCRGCRTRHIRQNHPNKVKHYMKNYIGKGI